MIKHNACNESNTIQCMIDGLFFSDKKAFDSQPADHDRGNPGG